MERLSKQFQAINYKGLKITAHAQARALERTQIATPEELGEKAFKALNDGVDAYADPVLRELCRFKAKRTKLDGIYYDEGLVFLFKQNALVTVMPLSFMGEFNKWHPKSA